MATDFPFVHVDDVPPRNMDPKQGWSISDFRIIMDGRMGCSSTIFRGLFMPGAIHKKHRHDNCDEMYYVLRGHGLAGAGDDRVELFAGHYHYIPRGTEHWLINLSKNEPIEVYGIYDRSPSVEPAARSHTVTMRSICGASGPANASHGLLDSPATSKPISESTCRATG